MSLKTFGSAIDAPSTDAEDTTARSGFSLLKGIKNYLRTLASAVSGTAVIVHGQKTVASAGTEEALGASTELTSGVRVKALAGNG